MNHVSRRTVHSRVACGGSPTPARDCRCQVSILPMHHRKYNPEPKASRTGHTPDPSEGASRIHPRRWQLSLSLGVRRS
jgi:hypothetical protein